MEIFEMNIFCTSQDPIVSAYHLDDKRINKMITESAQIVCTALFLNNFSSDIPYRPTHINHPVVKWTALNNRNLSWVLKWHFALHDLYFSLRKRQHLAFEKVGLKFKDLIVDKNPFNFCNCAANSNHNISFKHLSDVQLAYQLYLEKRWEKDKQKPTWINRNKPNF